MSDLVEWFGEQLDEDERITREATPGWWTPWRRSMTHVLKDLIHSVVTQGQKPGDRAKIVTASWSDAEHIARHNPARVLREIDAERQVLRDLEQAEFTLSKAEPRTAPHDLMTGAVNALRRTVRLLALPYADRPGYREEWRP
ncbi:DUF6221 family protein [Streptomyces sp. NPDC001530]|uniref:DUF6221 family protein n=1 Tax=Streptomyces sp. NPDC001530 TaxID=3364582 RepID=UPI0036C9CFCF